jgi:hypothetical protein
MIKGSKGRPSLQLLEMAKNGGVAQRNTDVIKSSVEGGHFYAGPVNLN